MVSLDDAVQQTRGVHRVTAFSDDHVWVGRVRDTPRQESGWHVHPGHETYAYSIEGSSSLASGRAVASV